MQAYREAMLCRLLWSVNLMATHMGLDTLYISTKCFRPYNWKYFAAGLETQIALDNPLLDYLSVKFLNSNVFQKVQGT